MIIVHIYIFYVYLLKQQILMGKSSRRVNRAGQSKEERKNNFKIARKNHLYNQATCKTTNRITRNVVTNSAHERTWAFSHNTVANRFVPAPPGQPYKTTNIPWTHNNIKKNSNPLFNAIFC